MSAQDHRAERRLIEDHFAGRTSRDAERELRAHLADCADCRRYYERHLLLAELDPRARTARERIGGALGLEPGARKCRWGVGVGALAGAGAFVLALALVPLGSSPPEQGFTARGGGHKVESPAAGARLHVYRVTEQDGGAPVGEVVGPDDELAFAYQNDTRAGHLMVFGVAEDGQVYWYHPAWQRVGENPTSVAVRRDGGLHELPEAVRHPLPVGDLRLVALWSEAPWTVRQAEAFVAAGGMRGDDPPGVSWQTLRLRVEPRGVLR